MIECESLFGWPSNTRFCDIWEDAATFLTEYKANALYTNDSANRISDVNATSLWYLLYSRYGNNAINAYDRNRFKYAVWTIIYQYGPAWEAKLALQAKIRNLTDNDLLTGAKAIYNHAYNPGDEPSTAALTELKAINEQSTSNFKKSKMDAYTQQWQLLSNDVTQQFISQFKKLFSYVVMPVHTPRLYEEPTVEEDE